MLMYNYFSFRKILYFFIYTIVISIITVCPAVIATLCPKCGHLFSYDHESLSKCDLWDPFISEFFESLEEFECCESQNLGRKVSSYIEKYKLYNYGNNIHVSECWELSGHKCVYDKYKIQVDLYESYLHSCREKLPDKIKYSGLILSDSKNLCHMLEFTTRILVSAGEKLENIIAKKVDITSVSTTLWASYALFYISNHNNPTSKADYVELYANWVALTLLDYYKFGDDGRIVENTECIVSKLNSVLAKNTGYSVCNGANSIIFDIILKLGASKEEKKTKGNDHLLILKYLYTAWNMEDKTTADTIDLNFYCNEEKLMASIDSNWEKFSCMNDFVFLTLKKESPCLCMIVKDKDSKMKVIMSSGMYVYESNKKNIAYDILSMFTVSSPVPYGSIPLFLIKSAVYGILMAGVASLSIDYFCNYTKYCKP